MDSFDSFCFPSLDHASERCVDEQQTAFVDSLLLPYVQSPRQTMPMTMAAPSINATQNCDNTSNLWLQQPHGQSYPQSSYPKEEANVSMSAMYSMLMNRIPARAANQTGSMNNLNATDIVPIALSAAAPAPATIMNLLSMTNSSSSALAASNSSASMKREDSNNSMSELDHEYDTASTVSPFSTSDGSLSSDEYPTPSVSPLAQSHPAAHFQAQIKLEANAAIVHHAHQGLHAQAHGHAQGGDDEFSIEIIAPPSNVLEGRRVNGNHSATSDVNASANATSNDSTSAPVKKRASQKKRTLNGKAEMQLSAVSGPNRKNAKRPAKRSYESSDDSDSEEELDDDAKHSKGSSASSSCSASGVDSKTRLARKAELARMSRRRKKMRLNDLEKEVKRLHEELAMLQNEAKAKQINTTMQQQIQTQADSQENETPNTTNSSMSTASTPIASSAPLPSASVSDEAEYAQLMSLMNDFVNGAKSVDSSAGADGAQRAESLLDLFVSGHASFLRSGSMHLNALNQHVQSILPFQFLNWMCTQGDAFYQDPSGLWRSLLVDELHLKADQLNDMDTFRHTVRKQYKHVVEIQKLFKRMSEAMEKQSAFSLQNMERIRTVLTPNQFAHFIDWVQKFGEICLKMHQ